MQVLKRIQDCGFDLGDPDSESSSIKAHSVDVSNMLKRCGYHDDASAEHSNKRKYRPNQGKKRNQKPKLQNLGKYHVLPRIKVHVDIDSAD